MKDKIYLIFDRLSNRYGSVFNSATDATASRAFAHQIQQTKLQISDFDLCAVGELDLATGVVTAYPTPKRVDLPSHLPVVPITEFEQSLEKEVIS